MEEAMLALSSERRLVAALDRARDVTLVAYLLPRGAIFDALAAAARRGAHVAVRLEGRPYYDATGGVRRSNESVARELSNDGADARVVDEDGEQSQLHAKAVAVDGALYLDDVNFSSGGKGTILRDGSRVDAASLHDVVAGRTEHSSRNVTLRKERALAMEAALIEKASRRDDVIVESESVGSGNLVYSRLERLGLAGRAPRLLISREALSRKELRLVHRLGRDGVCVRVCSSNEKFALAGRRAWIGSANATSAYYTPDQLDWGARTRSRAIVRQLRARFEARWCTSRTLPEGVKVTAR
jgi:phosphatidylserine/phosphatidylglycerophosphate/cardiolipin synthase-like enzyme